MQHRISKEMITRCRQNFRQALLFLVCIITITFSNAQHSNLSSQTAQAASNPIIFADVPDLSMIRVGKNYYMSSTTMHMSPGVPIMKSTDLVNWKIVSYAYDTLVSNDRMNLNNGKSTYGQGSWASSLRYHNQIFYVSTFAATSGKTHVYTTKNIEKGPWKDVSFTPAYHDHSLFFDDDGRVYLVFGAGKISLVELNADASGIKSGTKESVILENASKPAGPNIMLNAEGSQLFKVKGKYYLFNIVWPRAGMRTVIIHRADKLTGPWEGKVALQDLGVAQGGLISTQKGNWFSYLFRDYGAVGRIPYLVPVKWQDGWPVLGNGGKVPLSLSLPRNRSLIPGIVASDDFDRKRGQSDLPLVWQWNHNPVDSLWSIHERKGYLRLKTGRVDTTFLQVRNMLTQRTVGLLSTGTTSIDLSNMKDGDFAGLCLLQKNYGLVGVRVTDGKKSLVMVNTIDDKQVEAQTIPLNQQRIYLKAACDFTDKKDVATFYYSFDGETWNLIGTPLKMTYTLPHFMGYRFALFNYATKNIGGYSDFDFFHIKDNISTSN